VNLLQGEQRHPSYLAVNPQGKVPAIRVQGVPGLPDVCLYESQVTRCAGLSCPQVYQVK
jgi:glutathione S-transferase